MDDGSAPGSAEEPELERTRDERETEAEVEHIRFDAIPALRLDVRPRDPRVLTGQWVTRSGRGPLGRLRTNGVVVGIERIRAHTTSTWSRRAAVSARSSASRFVSASAIT